MKNVISVDELLKMELGYANDEECPICGHDHEDHEPIGARKKFKKNLHSLLISKLPEYRDITDDPFPHPESQDIYDAGFNQAVLDMRKSIDEMFKVQND